MSADLIHPTWRDTAVQIQSRLERSQAPLPEDLTTFREFQGRVRSWLLQALRDGQIKNSQHECFALLQYVVSASPRAQKDLPAGARVLIGGGSSDGSRFSDDPQSTPAFIRQDGARVEFSWILKEEKQTLNVLGYGFRIAFPPYPDNVGPTFLRVDMNLPSHQNETEGLRVHLHPGDNDIQLPFPWLSPEELLYLFFYSLQRPAKGRHHQP